MAEIRTLGEWGLLERIRSLCGSPSPRVLIPIGDDCALVESPSPNHLLVTCDALIEGVHFTTDFSSPRMIGRKALAVNLSDIAAMGGDPTFALVSLALSPHTPTSFVEEFYRGMCEEAGEAGVAIVGGNLSAAPQCAITVTLLGEVEPGRAVTRSGARPGEKIWVTGSLGKAAAGLVALQCGYQGAGGEAGRDALGDEERQAMAEAVAAYQTPRARRLEGRALAVSRQVAAMIDISDGLAADLLHICRSSHVSACLWEEKIPYHLASRVVERRYGMAAGDLVLQGGEDYELLFTSSATPEEIAVTLQGLTPAHCVGEVLPSDGDPYLQMVSGAQRPLHGGYDHFAQGPLFS